MHGVRLVSTPAMKSTPMANAGLDESCPEIPEKSMALKVVQPHANQRRKQHLYRDSPWEPLAAGVHLYAYALSRDLIEHAMTAAASRSTPARASANRAHPDSGAGYEPSYKAAAIAAAAVFLLYFFTIAPSTAMWDTGEYMAATKVLGLPHPPGNPFFMLIGHVFGELPLPGSYAQHINTMAALASACSAGFWFLITERVLSGWMPRSWQRYVGAALATLIGATAFTVWNQSVVNEKVYTISLFFFSAVSWLMISWTDDPEGPAADRKLVLVAYLLGLGYANHPAGMLAAPAVGFAILVRRWRTHAVHLRADSRSVFSSAQ